MGNIIFISKSFDNVLPPIFKNWFIFFSEIHNYGRASSSANKLFKPSPSYKTDSYGRNYIIIIVINGWNKTQYMLRGL